jgi:hypothetical protein
MSAALRLIVLGQQAPVSDSPRLARPNDLAVTWAADDAGLSQNEYRLLMRVYRRYNHARGCDESLVNMAEACRMSLNTARACKKVLIARGMLRETEREGVTWRLDVLDQAGWREAPARPKRGGKRTPTKPDPSQTTPLPEQGTPTNSGEGYPYQSRVDEVDPEVNTVEDEDADERAREPEPDPVVTQPRGFLLSLDDLPEKLAARRAEIEDAAGSDARRKGQLVARAFCSGNYNPPEVRAALQDAADRIGPLGVAAALVHIAATGRKKSIDSRLNLWPHVVADIESAAEDAAYAADPRNAGPGADPRADGRGAPGDERPARRAPGAGGPPDAPRGLPARRDDGRPAGAPGGRAGGAGRVVGTAAQRASTVTIRGLLDGHADYERRLAARADDDAGRGRGDDAGDPGGL